MAFSISPAVTVTERELNTAIPAVSAIEAGIAGHFRWGPVNQRVLLSNETDLVRDFGKPNANTADDFFSAASFLAYSNALYVARVVNEGTGSDKATNATTNVANTTATVIKNEDDYDQNYSSGIAGVGQFVAKYPGLLGNSLKVSVCPSSSAWESTLTGNVAVAANSTALTGNNTLFQTELSVGDIIVLGANKLEVKVSAIASNTAATITRYTGDAITINSSESDSVTRRWEYFNQFNSAPGTSDYVSDRSGSNDELHIIVLDSTGEISGVPNTVLERFEAVSLASDAKTETGRNIYYKDVINQTSRYMWWTAHSTNDTNAGDVAQGTTFTGQVVPRTTSFVGGKDGSLPRNADYISGYNLFKSTEDVDISFFIGAAANLTRALDLINNLGELRKDVVVTLSPEKNDVVNNNTTSSAALDDVIAFRDQLPATSYAVMDSGWKYMYDRYNDVYRWVPLNGDTAGLMVRSTQTRDAWISPAGYTRGIVKNVVKLAYNPNKAQRDQLYKKGINPVVTFPGQGTLLFGDKTMLLKPSPFGYIGIRRLFIVLEKAIATAAKYYLFEQNNEFTRSQFRNSVTPFLRDVQGREGIARFLVVADETNNPDAIVQNGQFVGDIYIQPIFPIETIQLNFNAVGSDVVFNEITNTLR